MTTLIPKFQQTETGAVNRPFNEKLAETVSVKDFGAVSGVLVGAAITANTAAIQAALNASDCVYFPAGEYYINSSLIKTIAADGGVKIYGDGVATKIKWAGPAITGPMIYIYSTGGSGFYQKSSISDLWLEGDDTFVNPNYLCGVQGIWLGNPSDEPAGGVCNCSIENVRIRFTNIGINIHSESDEVTITDCHIRVFNNYGIRFNSSSGIRIINNHIQDPINDAAVGIIGTGTAITITGNIIQTSASSFNGIYFDGVRGFTVANNYSEVAAGYPTNFWVKTVGCSTGSIYSNEVGGYVGAALIDISTTCKGVNIGPNQHSQSGGVILALVAIGAGATDINIIGKQSTSGAITLISGNPSFITNEVLSKFVSPITSLGTITGTRFTSVSSTTTIPGYAVATTFYTIPDIAAHTYLVTVTNGLSQYTITALVSVAFNSTPVVTILYATSANLTITVSGLNLQIVSNIVNTVAMTWSIVSIGE